MKLKTILAAPFFGLKAEDDKRDESILNYAVSLAQSQGAHLTIVAAALKLTAPSAFISEARTMVAAANEEVRKDAQAVVTRSANLAAAQGVSCDASVLSEELAALIRDVSARARLGDVTIMQPENSTLSLQQSLLENVLFESGRPVIVVPRNWAGDAAPDRVMVTWDGTAKSARAIGDALPLLSQAKEVEIVSASGDTGKTKKSFDGADIARHLSRHCAKVTVTQLPTGGDAAVTLRNHATLTRANMMVMGAYAHSRLLQMVLGGVTHAMIHDPPAPVFMSY